VICLRGRGGHFQGIVVSAEERSGVVEHVSEKGIVLGGSRLSYSKWFEGDRPTEDLLGCTIRVVVDAGDKVSFLKRILTIGEKAQGWKPPEKSEKGSWGGGGRRLSPEELELKKDEGIRIGRSVAIDRAISMARDGITIEKIADLALAVEAYLLKGELPQGPKGPQAEAPEEPGAEPLPSKVPVKGVSEVDPRSSPPPAPRTGAAPKAGAKPKRLASQAINALFNEALRGGVVDDWADFLQVVEDVLRVKGRSPYTLDIPSYLKLETVIRAKLGKGSAA